MDGIIMKSDAGAREAALVVKSGATTTVGTSTALSTSNAGIYQSYILNPTTSAEWSKSEVNAMNIGIKVTV
jgi:hypothetical protein